MTDVAINARARTRRRHRGLTRLALPGGVIGVLLLLALVGPILTGTIAGSVTDRLLGAGEDGHLLGTDGLGRDQLKLLVAGARPSMLMGVLPVLIGGAVGSVIGILGGLAGPKGHALVMRTLDVFYAFPAVLLAIAIAAPLGTGMWSVIVAISLVIIPPIARVAEGETRAIAEREFMQSARASGAGPISIAYRQAWPAVRAPIIVYCTTLVGLSIVFAGGLSYLGLGVQPPTPEWGQLIATQKEFIYVRPELALMPALVLFVAAMAFNALGDALHDVLNVKGIQS